MKNICFIANYYKTDVFVEIAHILKEHQITSYWIIPNRKQYLLLKKIFPENQLLYIGKKEVLAFSGEEQVVDLKINELVHGDRVLREESKAWTYSYMLKLQNVVYSFLYSNKISFVFGEVTWAHELLVHRLTIKAKDLGCQYLNPHTIRIPNGRFAFFTDEYQSKIKEATNKSTFEAFEIKLEKPAYLSINDKVIAKKGTLKHNLILIKNFVFRTNQDANDPTLYNSPLTQFKIRTAEIYNRLLFKKFVLETSIEDLPKNKKQILFTLHKQPEASIDVVGRYYENQLELIINIWRILPENYILLVKEHSNALGDRSLRFYKKVKELRNVYLINNKADSHKLLDIVEAVFTVSGTIAYEAALKNKKAYTFAPTFFNKMKGCDEVSWKDFKTKDLTSLIDSNKEAMCVNTFSNWLLAHSFDGIMSDSFGDPRCMHKENIEALSKAFYSVIETC
ncbi:hypothetical protein JJL45_03340 [Tamlana sp. s12]|uniref:hypothetical protein n=1 Tax=Tamlana sp. s12 TaxID=1630406 RepID=UPI0007FF0D20|nr:hypothetical protein [Tamlana sp. s12]OBQ54935.1 hypothetical protein VQ01_09315 [Tamlana sp. s12]QQY83042.1 hypothetical protein JJL45_03340 [Tamlana sp. s12]